MSRRRSDASNQVAKDSVSSLTPSGKTGPKEARLGLEQGYQQKILDYFPSTMQI